MDFDVAGLSGCRVLVVEDNQFNRMLALGFLNATGITQVAEAVDGIEGLEQVAAFDPDLVILDLMMPRMDGHEFLRRLRADPAHAELPVLVATALNSIEDRNQVFALGATDYLEKPINGREMMARVKVHLRNRMMLRSLTAYRDRVSQDLATVRVMQEMLLPPPAVLEGLAATHGLHIDAFFEASFQSGGDLWGCRPLDDRRMAVFIVDFSGHGVAAAVNTFRLRMVLDGIACLDDPAAVLTALNRAMIEMLPRGQYATMTYAVVDVDAGTLTFASAGAPSPIIGTPDGVAAQALRSLPLGITPDAPYANETRDFPVGGFLCLYSDALIELPDRDGRILDEVGAVELVAAVRDRRYPLKELLRKFRADGDLDDDLTVVWLAR